MYIVVEYLLIENFIINFFIFYLTKILVRSDVKIKKIAIGSALSSLYSLAFFFEETMFLTRPFFKLLLSILFIRIIFDYVNPKVFIKELLAFYVVSFIFAGATLGAFYSSMDIGELWNMKLDKLNGFPVKYLIIGVIISIIGGKTVFCFFNQRVIRENYIADLTISIDDKEIKIKALLDTGNSLISPFTKKKVIVVEYEKLKGLLPPLVKELLEANEENDYKGAEELLRELQEEIIIEMIPFNSVGNSGILFGVVPDYIVINYMGEIHTKEEGIIIGIFSGSLEREVGYSGLMHYGLIDGGIENEYIKVQN